jgi:predicted MFS family arabinose efflux permease
MFFSILGIMGFVGNLLAFRAARTFDAFWISACAVASLAAGLGVWSAGAGSATAMATGVVFWGLGFAAANSMQQARLIAAAPRYANLAVALNASCLFIGQALGATAGGVLYTRDLVSAIGYLATLILVAALAVLVLEPRAGRRPGGEPR